MASETSSRWRDVSGIFESAASALNVQKPMLHVDNFDLGKSANALEFMDPKMDPGMSKGSLPALETILADGTLPLVDLSAPQVLGIMDKLLTLQVRQMCSAVAAGQ